MWVPAAPSCSACRASVHGVGESWAEVVGAGLEAPALEVVAEVGPAQPIQAAADLDVLMVQAQTLQIPPAGIGYFGVDSTGLRV